MNNKNTILTYALPYANAPLHLGHIVGFVQTDIWKRFHLIQNKPCILISGNDCHGTPIMLKAQEMNITPQELVEDIKKMHISDLEGFNISLDNFDGTHNTRNEEIINEIYEKLKQNKDINKRTIKQAFDEEKQMFLPDRFVKGQCPFCKAENQYGDNCEACGKTYSPLELINPKSVISGSTPVEKESQHLFFDLEKYQKKLLQWIESDNSLQPEVKNKMQEWFKEKLKSWNISRDEPYFGFKIPNEDNKYFYVWMDAPVGYIANTYSYCLQNNVNIEEYWSSTNNINSNIYHFIGKDIIYFHTLFWPAILMSSNMQLPKSVFVHGFLTINGSKMSKSRGTFISAKSYLNNLNPEYLRYYLASKLNNKVEDYDLNLTDFKQRVDTDLIGKIVNIASRCSVFINKHFDNKLANFDNDFNLLKNIREKSKLIHNHYSQRNFSKALREITLCADLVNQYIANEKPWDLIKKLENELAQEVCSVSLEAYRIIMIYIKPICPVLSKDSESFLNILDQKWEDIYNPINSHTINKFNPLLSRILPEDITNMLEENKPIENTKPDSQYIGIDEFSKVDLRVGKIIHAENIEEADKLIKIQVDIGDETTKQVFAGIKKSYKPEDLINKLVVMVVNLKPRKMKFGISEGMILAASGKEDIWLVNPQQGATPGMKVK